MSVDTASTHAEIVRRIEQTIADPLFALVVVVALKGDTFPSFKFSIETGLEQIAFEVSGIPELIYMRNLNRSTHIGA
jgi:hypothetical protein